MESNNENADMNGTATGFLVVISWVDDCRYFGTLNLITEYESAITEHCKCTMEGVSKEFVSIQLNHNITDRTFELTHEDYWVKAVERFKEHLNDNGPNTRLIPLSPADEKLLVEPTEAEIKEAENLPGGRKWQSSCQCSTSVSYSFR